MTNIPLDPEWKVFRRAADAFAEMTDTVVDDVVNELTVELTEQEVEALADRVASIIASGTEPLTFTPINVKIEQLVFPDRDDTWYPVSLKPTARFAASILVPTGHATVEPVDPEAGIWSVQVPPNMAGAVDNGFDLTAHFNEYRLTIDYDPR